MQLSTTTPRNANAVIKLSKGYGGAGRNRTAGKGFADLRLTTWLPRRRKVESHKLSVPRSERTDTFLVPSLCCRPPYRGCRTDRTTRHHKDKASAVWHSLARMPKALAEPLTVTTNRCVSGPWQRRRIPRSAIRSRSARQPNCPIRSRSRRNSAPGQSPANT